MLIPKQVPSIMRSDSSLAWSNNNVTPSSKCGLPCWMLNPAFLAIKAACNMIPGVPAAVCDGIYNCAKGACDC